ncbi:MAG: TetR/AcrR family transcriptional regulator [Bacteroidaceae bacterium]|nr:TetR/AcrR family transcriptional regulator [Bacteroidaceae bacterium]MBP5523751.1 TetR/AcrR family transcriptional regulator [Bacteroidaceae bacterium]MBQ4380121.1 TetR/AcrR family transcriptional regulator [Bacteroidaceae bacterium]
MAVSKTRKLLVDVARQLFAKQGFESTTMNDIAALSSKGRRTLYTYFKSKEEVYYAVIQTELERLSERMEEVANKPIAPEEKLVQLVFTHLGVIKEAVYRNGNLRAEFFRDVWKVEAVRKNFDKNEINLIRRIMNEGNDQGKFEIRNVRLMAEIFHFCLKGCEVPFIYGRYAAQNEEELYPYVRNMIMKQLKK